MKYLITCFLAFFLLASNKTHTNKALKTTPSVVLQLFTSQGCSSCPSADEFLEIIKNKYAKENVVVMSYHVDYWNRLGWKDPFSSKEYTLLQYKYGQKLRARNVYTPQVIINGKRHYVGSDKNKITKNITSELNLNSENSISLAVDKKKNAINFNYTIDGDFKDKTVQVALVLENQTTYIKRGENHNRTLSNSNIVINTKSLKLTSHTGKNTIEIPEKYLSNKNMRLIAFVEKTNLDIVAATQKKL